jgi:hypothetical protein
MRGGAVLLDPLARTCNRYPIQRERAAGRALPERLCRFMRICLTCGNEPDSDNDPVH